MWLGDPKTCPLKVRSESSSSRLAKPKSVIRTSSVGEFLEQFVVAKPRHRGGGRLDRRCENVVVVEIQGCFRFGSQGGEEHASGAEPGEGVRAQRGTTLAADTGLDHKRGLLGGLTG